MINLFRHKLFRLYIIYSVVIVFIIIILLYYVFRQTIITWLQIHTLEDQGEVPVYICIGNIHKAHNTTNENNNKL